MDTITDLCPEKLALVDEETAPLLEAVRPEITAAIRRLADTLAANSEELADLILADAA
jgi:hypothetical protein